MHNVSFLNYLTQNWHVRDKIRLVVKGSINENIRSKK